MLTRLFPKKKKKKNKLIISNMIQCIGEVGSQVDWVYVVEFLKFSVLKSVLMGKIRNSQISILPIEYRVLEDFNWVLYKEMLVCKK